MDVAGLSMGLGFPPTSAYVQRLLAVPNWRPPALPASLLAPSSHTPLMQRPPPISAQSLSSRLLKHSLRTC